MGAASRASNGREPSQAGGQANQRHARINSISHDSFVSRPSSSFSFEKFKFKKGSSEEKVIERRELSQLVSARDAPLLLLLPLQRLRPVKVRSRAARWNTNTLCSIAKPAGQGFFPRNQFMQVTQRQPEHWRLAFGQCGAQLAAAAGRQSICCR